MTTSKQHERTQDRRNALQVLYHGELLGEAPSSLMEQNRLADETRYMGDYAKSILTGIEEELGQVDGRIEEASENWTLERMPLVDLSLLRLSTYEMLFVEDVPVSVSINEAVNLAKEFGGEDSPRFINGILGRIAKALDSQSDVTAEPPTSVVAPRANDAKANQANDAEGVQTADADAPQAEEADVTQAEAIDASQAGSES